MMSWYRFILIPLAAFVLSILVIIPGLVSSQSVIFARVWGGTGGGDDIGRGVAVDSADNIYVVGYSYAFGSVAVLLKYNDSGGLIWQKAWSAHYWSSGQAVAVDSVDNAYMTGFYANATSSVRNLFLVKIDPTGRLVWQVALEGSNASEGYAIAVDSSEDILVAGVSSGYGDGVSSCAMTGTSCNVLLVKFNSTGGLLWQRTWGGSKADYGFGVAVDSADNIYVTGSTQSFANQSSALLLLSFDGSGTLLWQRTLGGNGEDGLGIAVSPSSEIYVVGTPLISKFDSSGDLLWEETWGSGQSGVASGVTISHSALVYVTGGAYPFDGFIMHLDSSGHVRDASTFSFGTYKVAINSRNNAILAGWIYGEPSMSVAPFNVGLEPTILRLGVPKSMGVTSNFTITNAAGSVWSLAGSQSYYCNPTTPPCKGDFVVSEYSSRSAAFFTDTIVSGVIIGGITIVTVILITARGKQTRMTSSPRLSE